MSLWNSLVSSGFNVTCFSQTKQLHKNDEIIAVDLIQLAIWSSTAEKSENIPTIYDIFPRQNAICATVWESVVWICFTLTRLEVERNRKLLQPAPFFSSIRINDFMTLAREKKSPRNENLWDFSFYFSHISRYQLRYFLYPNRSCRNNSLQGMVLSVRKGAVWSSREVYWAS